MIELFEAFHSKQTLTSSLDHSVGPSGVGFTELNHRSNETQETRNAQQQLKRLLQLLTSLSRRRMPASLVPQMSLVVKMSSTYRLHVCRKRDFALITALAIPYINE